MSDYTIKAEMNPGGNPEYAPQKEMRDGIEADGFLLIAIKDGKPACTVIHHMTTMEIAQAIAGDPSEGGSVIRQAVAIAEGIDKAMKIAEAERKTRVAKELADMLMRK